MSNLIRCDWCDKELHEYHDTYFTLERGGIDMLSHSDPPGPWHFDAWVCLERFARVQDQRK